MGRSAEKSASRSARNKPITPLEARDAVLAVHDAGGNKTQAASTLGIHRHGLYRRLAAADQMGITAHGEIAGAQEVAAIVPKVGVARYIVTALQSNTQIHMPWWRNMMALADHYGAEIKVARVRYNHTRQHVAQEKSNGAAHVLLWYAREAQPYLSDDRVRLAPGLVWAGDMNELPTSVNPLSGLDSFSGLDSCIFPHMKIALRSVATSKSDPVKINYTTGAASLANYIKRKAGFKAEFHHAYAALLVEVDSDGDWFVRQINADRDAVIYDLDLRVDQGRVTRGEFVEAFTPGDIHAAQIDPVVTESLWGSGGLVDVLRPRNQVLHDILDMRMSHHATPFDRFRFHVEGKASVLDEIRLTANVMRRISRAWSRQWVVRSNHHDHLDRWVMESDFRTDPMNAEFYLAAASAMLAGIREGRSDPDVLEWALKREGVEDATFLARDEALTLAGIDMHHHGDIGPNGARGSVRNLAQIGRKTNIGHSHAANVFEGCYQAGTCASLDMGYNKGPSAWSHSHILTYENGKRAIITQRGPKWRAE